MNPFRQFEEAAEVLEAARRNLNEVGDKLSSFKSQAAAELNTIFQLFADNSILGGVSRNDNNSEEHFYGHYGIANEHIRIRGQKVKFGFEVSPESDPTGAQLTQEIAESAQAKGIPVKQAIIGGYAIAIDTTQLKEPEKYPETLLRAFGAYAESKGKSHEATLANAAADRMQVIREEIVGKASAQGQAGSQAATGQVNAPDQTNTPPRP